MARSVKEWIGKNDDEAPPPRVRVRVFDRCEGRCDLCRRKIGAGEKWTLEHRVALINGGANAEKNLGVTCDWCLPGKNAEDVAIKSDTYDIRRKHLGIKTTTRPLPGGRLSRFKLKVGGGVVDRITGEKL